jgi:hypothetical protein
MDRIQRHFRIVFTASFFLPMLWASVASAGTTSTSTRRRQGEFMKLNEGNIDRSFRIAVGLLFLGLGFFFQSLWGLVGLAPLVTGIVGTCPIYSLLGITSCPTKAIGPTA